MFNAKRRPRRRSDNTEYDTVNPNSATRLSPHGTGWQVIAGACGLPSSTERLPPARSPPHFAGILVEEKVGLVIGHLELDRAVLRARASPAGAARAGPGAWDGGGSGAA